MEEEAEREEEEEEESTKRKHSPVNLIQSVIITTHSHSPKRPIYRHPFWTNVTQRLTESGTLHSSGAQRYYT